MKRFNILDKVSGNILTGMDLHTLVIDAKNGKSALQKFLLRHAMSSGMYEIHKDLTTGCYRCFSTYGSEFIAMEVNK